MRDILHDRDGQTEDRHYSRFASVSSHALKTHTAVKGGFIYTYALLKRNAEHVSYHGVSRCLVLVFYCFFFSLSFEGVDQTSVSSRGELCQHTQQKMMHFALQSADCSHLKKKKKKKKNDKKKNKNVLGAKARVSLPL